eukprot:6542462-Prymnesium_polylepis.1
MAPPTFRQRRLWRQPSAVHSNSLDTTEPVQNCLPAATQASLAPGRPCVPATGNATSPKVYSLPSLLAGL